MDSREEIKSKLSIYDLVSRYVKLSKAGRNFKGLCPFHNEKTPSFVVSPEKDIAFCFGCQKGGDIFEFYQLVEACDFGESMRALADMTGVKLGDKKFNKEEYKEIKSKKNTLKDVHKTVSDFYVDQLWNTKSGKKVLEYVRSRGLTDKTIKDFKLGFAPDSFDETYRFLLSKGYAKGEIVEAGLASTKDASLDKIFDRFRLRLMFPIFDARGEVVAFGGRALKAEEKAKYLNSPETDIYHKSDILYGFYQAKEACRKFKKVIVVEGYFDQILTFQAGFENVVASSGTALTVKQVNKLSKFVDVFQCCFDSDKAGREALLRASELILASEKQIRVIDLGEFKDTGEMLGNDPKEKEFEKALNEALDIFDFLLEGDFKSVSLNKRFEVENVSRFLDKILPLVKKISSSVVKDIVLRKIAMHLHLKVKHLYDALKKYDFKKIAKTEAALKQKMQITLEEYFWALSLLYPDIFWAIKLSEKLNEKSFIFKEKQVYLFLEDYYNNAGKFDDLDLMDLPENLLERYKLLSLYLEANKTDGWTELDAENEFKKIVLRLLKNYKKQEVSRIQEEIKIKEKSENREGLKELFQELQNILALK